MAGPTKISTKTGEIMGYIVIKYNYREIEIDVI
jgi:hypothetical protein